MATIPRRVDHLSLRQNTTVSTSYTLRLTNHEHSHTHGIATTGENTMEGAAASAPESIYIDLNASLVFSSRSSVHLSPPVSVGVHVRRSFAHSLSLSLSLG
jgi:hypothetical protein